MKALSVASRLNISNFLLTFGMCTCRWGIIVFLTVRCLRLIHPRCWHWNGFLVARSKQIIQIYYQRYTSGWFEYAQIMLRYVLANIAHLRLLSILCGWAPATRTSPDGIPCGRQRVTPTESRRLSAALLRVNCPRVDDRRPAGSCAATLALYWATKCLQCELCVTLFACGGWLGQHKCATKIVY